MASMGKEGSDFLAEALKQMDGIIASSKFDYQNGFSDTNSLKKNHSGRFQYIRAVHLMEELMNVVEVCEDKRKVLTKVSPNVLQYLQIWLTERSEFAANGYIADSVEAKLDRLECDKQSLTLQVSVLTEQVEAQGEKIRDLEYTIDIKGSELMSTEEMLQSELLTRSSLETHKLDLMAEISSLKIRLATSEKDRKDSDDKLRLAQRQITDLETRLIRKDLEISDIKQRQLKNGTILNGEASGDRSKDRILEKERTLDRLRRKQTEVEKLKKAVDSLMVSNDEKDKRLEELRKMLKRYKKIEAMVLQAQGKKALDELLIDDDSSSTNSSINETLKEQRQPEDSKPEHRQYMPTPTATSTPVNTVRDNHQPPIHNNNASPPSMISGTPRNSPAIVRSSSCEDMTTLPPKTPPSNKHKGDGYATYGTLPKDGHSRDQSRDTKKHRAFPLFGKTLSRAKSGKRSSSAPNLAQTEVVTDDEDVFHRSRKHHTLSHGDKKKKGIRKFFGRLRRSSSQDLDNEDGLDPGEFRRGGVRSTAGARLGWSRDLKGTIDLDIPFARWDRDRVSAWLHELGLSMYVVDCRRWIKNGEQLLRASAHDLEKELGMRNCLHRKKLQLALQAIGSESRDKLEELDHNWVTRWLDDIGLPQYKDQFYDSRIDGRMLHFLTVEDLLALKVINELHHISIRRAIQALRVNNFNSNCLRRRPTPGEGHLVDVPEQVMLWTNHRVMEWLRTIDLSEYAPNLRGSGVHGALMVLESRFNAELFAQVLSIPTSKTLLRRHLNTHFVNLVGQETQKLKRDYQTSAGFSPLIPNTKIRHRGKFGIFGHKRSKSETEADGYICPMDGSSSNGGMDQDYNGVSAGSPALIRDQKQKDSKAATQIGAVSKEISSLTNKLSHERFMEGVPSSNV